MLRPQLICNQISMLVSTHNGVRSYTVRKGAHELHFQKPWDAFNIFCLMATPTWPATSTIGVVVSPKRRQVLFDVPIMRNMYEVQSLRKIGYWVIQVVFFSDYCEKTTSTQIAPAA
jgi:hypothetical protein